MNENKKTITVGGQAVIEGVMMRSPNAIATAVRRPNGEIVIRTRPFTSLLQRYRWLNIPVFRGSIAIFEMLIIGTGALQYSAEMAEPESDKNGKEGSSVQIFATTILALGAGLLIFFGGPIVVASRIFGLDQSAWQFNLVSGLVRITLFLGYLIAISRMKDIHRLFQYHGAEHVSIYTFENKEPLEPENGLKYDTPHPRCGTSFLMFVMIASVLSFAVIDSLYMRYVGELGLWQRLALHLPFIPIVAGISYELIRLSGRFYGNVWARFFMKPGLWLQRITTKKPDVTQIEVAMAALKAALGETVLREYHEGAVTGAMSIHE